MSITDGTGLQLGPETIQLSSHDFTGSFDQKKFYIVKDASGNLSKGALADYTADAKGKIDIVKRGEFSFDDTQKYAQAAGAAGLLLANTAGKVTT